jgi:hypothetical protein
MRVEFSNIVNDDANGLQDLFRVGVLVLKLMDSHLDSVNGLQDLFRVGVLVLKLMMILGIISKHLEALGKEIHYLLFFNYFYRYVSNSYCKGKTR